jgi:agmatinase
MKPHDLQFLGTENEFAQWETAQYALLPVPYEGAVSYGRGAAAAPEAVLEASCFLEFYDEALKFQPHEAGIVTLAPPPISDDHAQMHQTIYEHTREILNFDKVPVILGGDHSISSGVFRALQEKYGQLSCIQIDAHADLRDSYEGSIYSHASVMARIREMTPRTLQIGIRSMSREEAEAVGRNGASLCTMHDFRRGFFALDETLEALPNPVFLTFDVDAFDWSVITSTGTPEPGGFTWDEAMNLLWKIFERKQIIGFDVVELSADPHDRNSPFAVAKLLYKMIGFCSASKAAQ